MTLLGVLGILILIGFEPTLSSWLFTHTSPPIKVYKVVTPEKRDNNQPQGISALSHTKSDNLLEDKQAVRLDDTSSDTNHDHDNGFESDHSSENSTTIEEVTLPPPKRKQKDISPEVAAAAEESQRLREITAEMRSLINFIHEDRDLMLRFLDLEEEYLNIHKARGTLHIEGFSPFVRIKIDRLLASFSDGKIPISIGEELASIFAQNGNHQQADRIRLLTRRAIEKGDKFYKVEHMEDN